MIFKILSTESILDTEHTISLFNKDGIKVNDVRIAPLDDEKGQKIKELYLLICEGTQEQLDKAKELYGLEYRQEYEGTPLYY